MIIFVNRELRVDTNELTFILPVESLVHFVKMALQGLTRPRKNSHWFFPISGSNVRGYHHVTADSDDLVIEFIKGSRGERISSKVQITAENLVEILIEIFICMPQRFDELERLMLADLKDEYPR